MRTANEMYKYCLQNDFGKGWNEKWALKHFGVLEQTLQSDEEVKTCYIGIHNYVSATQASGNFAYAITNKRIIFGQKGLFGQTVKSVSLNTVNDITLSCNNLRGLGVITFDTLKERFNTALNQATANKVYAKIHEVIDLIKHPAPASVVPTTTAADEILKYKNLLDMGAITQEEFESKKKQLLGL